MNRNEIIYLSLNNKEGQINRRMYITTSHWHYFKTWKLICHGRNISNLRNPRNENPSSPQTSPNGCPCGCIFVSLSLAWRSPEAKAAGPSRGAVSWEGLARFPGPYLIWGPMWFLEFSDSPNWNKPNGMFSAWQFRIQFLIVNTSPKKSCQLQPISKSVTLFSQLPSWKFFQKWL